MLLNPCIDWLSVSFKCTYFYEGIFCYKLNDYSTKYFAKSFSVLFGGLPFGNVLQTPHSSILHENLCILKVENRVLYSAELFDIIDMFLKVNKCTDIKLSRLDLCVDFQKYSNNRPVQYVLNSLVNNKFTIVTKQDIHVIYDSDSKRSILNYRIGKRSSDISSYIYNKTKELNEVKMKPYIVERWKKLNYNPKLDVYRHEYCINNENYHIVNESTGELIKMSYEFIKSTANLNLLFNVLYSHYFDVRLTGTNKRKDRLKKIVTLPLVDNNLKIHAYSDCLDSNRSDRIFISKMIKEYQLLREYREDLANNLLSTAKKYASEKSLYKYLETKFTEITNEIL